MASIQRDNIIKINALSVVNGEESGFFLPLGKTKRPVQFWGRQKSDKIILKSNHEKI